MSDLRRQEWGEGGYPPEFRRKVLGLIESGRGVADVAYDLEISEQTINTWRRHERIVDTLEHDAATAPTDQVLTVAAKFDNLIVLIADSAPLHNLAASAGVFGRARRRQAVEAMRRQNEEVALAHLGRHRDILDALRLRDADQVEQLVKTQLMESLTMLLSRLSSKDPLARTYPT